MGPRTSYRWNKRNELTMKPQAQRSGSYSKAATTCATTCPSATVRSSAIFSQTIWARARHRALLVVLLGYCEGLFSTEWQRAWAATKNLTSHSYISPRRDCVAIAFMGRASHHERDYLISNSSICLFALSSSKGPSEVQHSCVADEKRGDLRISRSCG